MVEQINPTTAAITFTVLALIAGYRCWILPALKKDQQSSADQHI